MLPYQWYQCYHLTYEVIYSIWPTYQNVSFSRPGTVCCSTLWTKSLQKNMTFFPLSYRSWRLPDCWSAEPGRLLDADLWGLGYRLRIWCWAPYWASPCWCQLFANLDGNLVKAKNTRWIKQFWKGLGECISGTVSLDYVIASDSAMEIENQRSLHQWTRLPVWNLYFSWKIICDNSSSGRSLFKTQCGVTS